MNITNVQHRSIPEQKYSPSAKIKKKYEVKGNRNKDHAVRSAVDWYSAQLHLTSTNKKCLWIVL
jgi:hypothetical protein